MKFSKLTFISLICVCCVGAGILSGVVLSWLQPKVQTNPLLTVRANTSDRVDGYLTCTGYVEGGIEAVYVLDSTTGVLSAGVLSKNPKVPGFQSTYQGNVNVDLEKALMIMSKMSGAGNKKTSRSSSSTSKRNKKDKEAGAVAAPMLPTEPKYIMTSGTHDVLNQGSGIRPSASALYVTECNTGLTLVYVLPWNPAFHSNNSPFSSPITYYTFYRFLAPMVMEEAVDEE